MKNLRQKARRIVKPTVAVLLLAGLFLLFAGCKQAPPAATASPAAQEMEKFTHTFTGTFDTVITITAYAKDQAQFDTWASAAQQRFGQLHQLFDQYNNYDGVVNIKSINDAAGGDPIKVDPLIIRLLQDSIKLGKQTGGKVNIAMGAVLQAWSAVRDQADPKLPDMDTLKQLAGHTNIDDVIIDEAAGTVQLKDAQMALDVGAVAKGFATALIADELKDMGAEHVLLNSGSSSITMVGAPADRDNWVVALRNPMAVTPDQGEGAIDTPKDVPDHIATLRINSQTISNSGDYQRFVVIDGWRYHHLIDPDTLMPAEYYRAVSVITPDAYTSDFMSSALYFLPYEQSRKLAESLGLEAVWIFNGMRTEMTDGMKQWLQPQQ